MNYYNRTFVTHLYNDYNANISSTIEYNSYIKYNIVIQ